MKLHEISKEFLEVKNLENEDECCDDAIKNTLDAIEIDFASKVENLIKIIENNNMYLSGIDSEIDRLKNRKIKLEKKINSYKEYIMDCMKGCEIKKVQTQLFDISIAKGRDIVIINDEKLLPENYKEIREAIHIDKRKLLEALKAGDVPGAFIGKSQESLRIK